MRNASIEHLIDLAIGWTVWSSVLFALWMSLRIILNFGGM